MSKEKASRNKTIDISVTEGSEYLGRCIKVGKAATDIAQVTDKTILGDTFKVCPRLPAKSVDLIIADPPYNLRKTYGSTTFSRKKAEEYEDFTRKWLAAVKPLLKDNGTIYVCCDWESSLIVGRVLGEFFTVRNRITWQREKGRGARANWKNGMEDIWFATNSDKYTFNLNAVKVRRRVLAPYRADGSPKDWQESAEGKYRDTCPSNFWDDITVPFWSMSENTAHPTQKPEKLIAKLILASSNKGDMVFDPFAGSGTTLAVAKKLGRHYLGVEKEKQYCIWAEYRLERAEADKEIQGLKNGVFLERNYPRNKKSD
ncbi:MAG: site-specific DNA-methyltransferase [Clostridia bacterium]|nr:site-specific DNA-methyltransferase [Clostridia bacterium]